MEVYDPLRLVDGEPRYSEGVPDTSMLPNPIAVISKSSGCVCGLVFVPLSL
jgi:hypothetical protein